MIRIIRTRYLGRTETKGPRISATDLKTGERLVVPYDHELDNINNRCEAADALERRLRGVSGDTNVAKHCFGSVEDSVSLERFHVYEAE